MSHTERIPQHALQSLQQGNARFVSGQTQPHDDYLKIKQTANAQTPKAIVLGCMDSRCAPEIVFDQGIGDILTIRVAGHVLNQDNIASLAFGTKALGASLIVVLGHTRCGAISAACKQNNPNEWQDMLATIQPAINTVEQQYNTTLCDHPEYADEVAKQHVLNTAIGIPQQSKTIRDLLSTNKLAIVGAMYDASTGEVTFFDDLTN
jgi:carbonic anhydrase